MSITDDSKGILTEFLQQFGELEFAIKTLLNQEPQTEFVAMLKEIEGRWPALRQRVAIMRELAKLRNLLAHTSKTIGPIFPSKENLQVLLESISDVQRLNDGISNFRKPIREFKPDEPIGDMLQFMKERDFSQIVVRRDRKLELLTAVDVSEWLSGKVTADVISIGEHTIGDVLDARPQGRRFGIVSLNSTIGAVEKLFVDAALTHYSALFCILVTQSGAPTERAIGIITPWDLLH